MEPALWDPLDPGGHQVASKSCPVYVSSRLENDYFVPLLKGDKVVHSFWGLQCWWLHRGHVAGFWH